MAVGIAIVLLVLYLVAVVAGEGLIHDIATGKAFRKDETEHRRPALLPVVIRRRGRR